MSLLKCLPSLWLMLGLTTIQASYGQIGYAQLSTASATIQTQVQVTSNTPKQPISPIQTSTTIDPAILTPTQSRQSVKEIVSDKAFSQKIDTTKWVENHPKTQANMGQASAWQRFWRWVFEHLGKDGSESLNLGNVIAMVVKIALLLGLLGFVLWLIKHRDTWLDWFRRVARLPTGATSGKIAPHIAMQRAPIWQGLPERHQLVAAIHQALQQQAWLVALSLLYRGTLREILSFHELPITRATTEAQCRWLLNQAPSRRPDEAQFFTQLVAVWSQVAYGQHYPKSPVSPTDPAHFAQTVLALTQDWQRLYLQASPPHKVTKPPIVVNRHRAKGVV